ncbi:MAG: hypothetical protein MNPFHGCM_01274 [Gemmatimonadaceae bacterium]|nr:hypothetical protein [Gemmatimonadaceae bacterium]
MNIPVFVEPRIGSAPAVSYRWDPDTDILSAQLSGRGESAGVSGSVDLEGSDGSWLILDVAGGRINGVEVAVWPTVRKRSALVPPEEVEDASVVVPANPGLRVDAVEVNTAMAADSDHAERTIHFRLGPRRATRTVRIAREVLLDIDTESRLAGVWLLDVPPFPEEA